MKRTAKELLKAKDQEEIASAETLTLLVHECTTRIKQKRTPSQPQCHREKNIKTKPAASVRCFVSSARKMIHCLNDCKKFLALDFDNRKTFLKENRICFNCLESTNHIAKRCEKGKPECATCSLKHATALHDPHRHPSEPKTDAKCTYESLYFNSKHQIMCQNRARVATSSIPSR